MSTRVALVGNMNNAHFALTRYLRDRGMDAQLLLMNNEFAHFDPMNDTYGAATRNFVRRLKWGSVAQYVRTPSHSIRSDLEGYDAVIGCGSAPAYAAKAGVTLDVFVPFGGDIWAMLGRSDGNPLRLLKYAPLVRAQARGIGGTRIVHMAPTNHLYEAQVERYAPQSERWRNPVPVLYHHEYAPDLSEKQDQRSLWATSFQTVRESADLMLFSAARHVWKTVRSASPAAKGTDRLLRGLAILKERNPQCRVRLVTLEYGSDVRHSKRLIRRLGLDDVVAWFPRMARKELMVGLGMSDVACGEFENSWVASGVLYEGLVMAKPVLAYRDERLYAGEDLYPILNAREPSEIADVLQGHADAKPQEIGAEGRRWYLRRVAGESVDRYIDALPGRRGIT